MNLNNVNEIRPDDFSKDDRNVASQLASILNPFMQEVKELSDGRIDFENRVESFRQLEFTVDANGVPLLNNKINTGNSGLRGFQVVAAFNQTNAAVTVDSQPFIAYTPIGGGTVTVNKITGLVPNNKYLLNVIVY